MKDIIVSQTASYLLPTIFSVLGTLGTFVLGSVNAYLKTKTTNAKVSNALERITHTAGTVVSELMQTMVIGLKKKASDGKLTAADKRFLKDKAIETITARLNITTLQDAGLGVNDVAEFVKSKVEEAVFKAKPVVSYMDSLKKYTDSFVPGELSSIDPSTI